MTGTHPAYHAMEAYAALIVAAQAINAAKSVERPAILDAIRKVCQERNANFFCVLA